MTVDALGNPLRFILTGGERHDGTQAEALVEDYVFAHLLADKSYDSDDFIQNDFIQKLAALGIEVVIPSRVSRIEQREYDKHWYKERHFIECFVNKIKQYRRILSRFEKLSKRYRGFLSFAAALIWLC